MTVDKRLFDGYENTRLVSYKEIAERGMVSVDYSDLKDFDGAGVLKACRYIDGKLVQTYSTNGNHVGVIAATRLGKTTSYVIPTVLSFARQNVKKSMIISDPKGEIYRTTAAALREQGYNVRLLNFRDYRHSECWNPMTPIFRKYAQIDKVYDEVEVVKDGGKYKNRFHGIVYDSQPELDEALNTEINMLKEDVYNDVDILAGMVIETQSTKDPTWEDNAREVFKAFIFAMLEDSELDDGEPNKITEHTFSFNTILRVMSTFSDSSSFEDQGYFSRRGENSKALAATKTLLLQNAPVTRRGIMSTLSAKISVLRESTIRLITSCNTFEFEEVVEKPTVIFIDYRDEVKAHYRMISLFVQDAYRYFIQTANAKISGKLDVPLYFILDEFGNFPAIRDFETTISACAGRSIFFILIIQSYAQLNCVYGNAVAEIIKDNLNVHIFFGSNNPNTLKEFSNECGEQTRVSPLSALNGTGTEIEHYQFETIPLVTKSRLSHFEPGECIVTEANCEYVMFSRLERYYLCKEFADREISSEQDYLCPVNLFSKRYQYTYVPARGSSIWD